MKNILAIILLSMVSFGCQSTIAQHKVGCVGASLAQGSANPVSFATGFGGFLLPGQDIETSFPGYIDLCDGMQRKNMKILNAGQAGSATFTYTSSLFGPIPFPGYGDQLTTLLGWATVVSVDEFFDPIGVEVNLDAIVTTLPSDCMHSLIGDITTPCTTADYHVVAQNLVDHGNDICDAGVKPIFDKYMPYDQIDWSVFTLQFGAAFVISESGWDEMKDIVSTRLDAEVTCGAVQLDLWGSIQNGNYDTIGDGLHPDESSMKRAAKAVKQAIDLF